VNAGDNQELMIAPSAYPDSYSDNKVLYKKIVLNTVEVFEYSNDPQEELFNVRFSLVGSKKGNYVLTNAASISRIYEYIAPINTFHKEIMPDYPISSSHKNSSCYFF
jgi:hypothetical protein